MRRIALVAGASALAFAAGLAVAQQLSSRTLTGNETITAAIGGPGGSGISVPVAQLRNAQGTTNTALTTGTFSMPITSASLISTAASASLTVNLPASPYDGQIFEWINGSAGAFTAGTVAVTDGSTIQGSTAAGTLAAGASIEYRYSLASNTWYKLR